MFGSSDVCDVNLQAFVQTKKPANENCVNYWTEIREKTEKKPDETSSDFFSSQYEKMF